MLAYSIMEIVNLIKMNKQLKSCGQQLAKWASVVVLVTGLNGGV